MVNIKGSKAWLGVLEYLCDPQWLRAKKTAVFLQDSQADVMWPSPAQWDRFLAKRPVQPSSQFKKKMLCVCGGKKNPQNNQFSLLLLHFPCLSYASFPFIYSSHSCSMSSFTLSITNLILRGPVWNKEFLEPAPLCPCFFLYTSWSCALCPGMQLTASLWKEMPSHNRMGGMWHPLIQTEYNVISPMGSAERNEFPLRVMYEAASAISVCWASCFIPSFPANL